MKNAVRLNSAFLEYQEIFVRRHDLFTFCFQTDKRKDYFDVALIFTK